MALGMLSGAAAGQTDAGSPEVLAGQKLTLTGAIQLALQNSRSVIGAQLSRQEQELLLDVAEDRYLPKLEISAATTAYSARDETASGRMVWRLRVPTGGNFRLSWDKPLRGEAQAGDYQFGFTQPLLKGFGSDVETASLRKTRLRERIHVSNFRSRVASVVTSVIDAFRSAIRAERALAISRASLERARNQLETNRALVDAGRLAAREILQTEAEVANREISLIESENGFDAAIGSLIDALDIDEDTPLQLSDDLEFDPVRPALKESLDTAFARRTDYLEARLGLESALIDLGVAKNDRLWDLSLAAETSGGGGGHDTENQVGLTLSIPLLDRAPRLALLQANNDVRRAEMSLAESRQAIRIEVRQRIQDADVGLRRIDLARRSRELAEEKLAFEQRKLSQGLTSTYRLTQAEDDLVRAQNGELDAILGYLNALTSLDTSLGTTLDRWGIEVERLGAS